MPRDFHSFATGEMAARSLRAQHDQPVRANDLKLDARWEQPCCAFNLHIRPDSRARRQLAMAQAAILCREPGLLRVPEHALHVSVAWLLPVHEQFTQGKEALWSERGAAWWEAACQVLTRLGSFTLRYGDIVATDSAIIALAEPGDVLRRVRTELSAALGLPWDLFRGDLTHTTMFRYGQPLADPGGLLSCLHETALGIEFPVEEVYLVREDVFPSLRAEVLASIRIAPPITPHAR